MLTVGFIEDWQPAVGAVTTWTVTDQARQAAALAPAHRVAPSFQQRAYLRTVADRPVAARLRILAFDLPGAPDPAALRRAVLGFLRRHDTFAGRFAVTGYGTVTRHQLHAEQIDIAATGHGQLDDPAAIRELVISGTPAAPAWECFSFGVIEHDDSFTVYAAIDHLHTDGIGQILAANDLLTLYQAEISGSTALLAPAAGHVAHCDRENRFNEQLIPRAAPILQWAQLLRPYGDELPGFPLPLGDSAPVHAHRTATLLHGEQAERFEQICSAHGGRFAGGVVAALALTEALCTDRRPYFVLAAVDTRTTVREAGSVGWYTAPVPLVLNIGARHSFSALVAEAQDAAGRARELRETSVHRVLELLDLDRGDREPTRVATTLSISDLRTVIGAEEFGRVEGGLHGCPIEPGAVGISVDRLADRTTISIRYPDTAAAYESIQYYLTTACSVFGAIATDGDVTIRPMETANQAVPLR
ncbi:condensation domain-containing protein [Nocardia stercoris]|uniref:condensation domain-containing protein n=1 Tax=Nocardia stercoris TaxID=2483361 RepID=UPI001319CCEE|nr:condensation domain-containing protein [Nocardia stercoris]